MKKINIFLPLIICNFLDLIIFNKIDNFEHFDD